MKSAGLNAYRDEIFWSFVEKQRNVLSLEAETSLVRSSIDAAKGNGFAPILILDYGNSLYGGGFPLTDESRKAFAAYAGFMATRFTGKIRYYEVWNEWNGGMGHEGATEEMRAPETYLKLLQATHAAVKAADPSAVVVGGATDGNERWAEQLVALGGMRYMDILSIHPYMFHARKDGTPELLVDYLTRVGATLAAANGGTTPPVFITETGWPTFDSEYGVSRETAADYVARTLLAVRAIPFVKGIWWYELQDSGTNANDIQHNFGLLDSPPRTEARLSRDAGRGPAGRREQDCGAGAAERAGMGDPSSSAGRHDHRGVVDDRNDPQTGRADRHRVFRHDCRRLDGIRGLPTGWGPHAPARPPSARSRDQRVARPGRVPQDRCERRGRASQMSARDLRRLGCGPKTGIVECSPLRAPAARAARVGDAHGALIFSNDHREIPPTHQAGDFTGPGWAPGR